MVDEDRVGKSVGFIATKVAVDVASSKVTVMDRRVLLTASQSIAPACRLGVLSIEAMRPSSTCSEPFSRRTLAMSRPC